MYTHSAKGPRDLPSEDEGNVDDAVQLANEDDSVFDVSGWEVEEDGVAPVGDASVTEASSSVHGAISSHVPVDSSQT